MKHFEFSEKFHLFLNFFNLRLIALKSWSHYNLVSIEKLRFKMFIKRLCMDPLTPLAFYPERINYEKNPETKLKRQKKKTRQRENVSRVIMFSYVVY